MNGRTLVSLLATALLVLAGCATPRPASDGLTLMSSDEFEKTVNAFSDHKQTYSGLYNTLDVQATLVNSSVAHAQANNSARLYQWDRARYEAETGKQLEKRRSQTEVFLSFFTPEKKNDDLNKAKTQWKVYLENGGRRWEGKVTKLKLLVPELQGLYPYHNRFATPYSVSFPVGTATIEGQASMLLITGPIGRAELNFPAATAP